MRFSKGLEDFNILRSAEGASPHTIQAYRWGLEKLMLFHRLQAYNLFTTAPSRAILNAALLFRRKPCLV